MNREQQFEVFKDLFTWEEEFLGHYKFSFMAHYRILNDMLNNCAERFKTIGIPRVDYFLYTEYVYLIYSELGIVLECLFKSLLEESGYNDSSIRKSGHDLTALLQELSACASPKNHDVYNSLCEHKNIMEYYKNEKVFVDARYMEHKEDVALFHLEKIWPLILEIDSIYKKYYATLNIVDLVYPSSM